MHPPRDPLRSPPPLLRETSGDLEGPTEPIPPLSCAACYLPLTLEALDFDPARQDVVHRQCRLTAGPASGRAGRAGAG